MSFDGVFKIIRISKDRIGVVVGKGGVIKSEIESKCGVLLDVNGETGEVAIMLKNNNTSLIHGGSFKASEIILAISKGFSPEKSFRLLSDENILQLIDLRDYAGKSSNSLERIKSRIIGQNGKFRKNLEDFTGTYISVYGHFVGFIGNYEETSLVLNAITMLCKGSSHKSVYGMLEEYKRKKKLEKIQLWENNNS